MPSTDPLKKHINELQAKQGNPAEASILATIDGEHQGNHQPIVAMCDGSSSQGCRFALLGSSTFPVLAA
uniref:Uncharacterized protein n=1 Tax=Arundo donax TaxID=35708 RepID=A0A0A9GB27_ARUDO